MNSTPFYLFLSSNGDGSGGYKAISNYGGVAARVFYLQPPDHLNFNVERMIIHVEDGGNFNANNYGGAASPLTNGIVVRKRDQSNNVWDLTTDPVQQNADWSQYCYDLNYITFGNGNNFVQVRWTFAKAGVPLVLDGGKGERLEVVCQDDMSGLVDHTFQVQGVQDYSYSRARSTTVSNTYIGSLSNTTGSTNAIVPEAPPPILPGPT